MTDLARQLAELLEPVPKDHMDYFWADDPSGDDFEQGLGEIHGEPVWPRSKLGLWECAYYEPYPAPLDGNFMVAVIDLMRKRGCQLRLATLSDCCTAYFCAVGDKGAGMNLDNHSEAKEPEEAVCRAAVQTLEVT